MNCPFCSSENVERIAQWGGQMITAQWRCHECSSYFEAVREDFDEPRGGEPGQAGPAAASMPKK